MVVILGKPIWRNHNWIVGNGPRLWEHDSELFDGLAKVLRSAVLPTTKFYRRTIEVLCSAICQKIPNSRAQNRCTGQKQRRMPLRPQRGSGYGGIRSPHEESACRTIRRLTLSRGPDTSRNALHRGLRVRTAVYIPSELIWIRDHLGCPVMMVGRECLRNCSRFCG